MSESQTSRVLAALLNGDNISEHEARARFGCKRIARQIRELRRRGYAIAMRAESGNGEHYAVYFLRTTSPPVPPAEAPGKVETNRNQLF